MWHLDASKALLQSPQLRCRLNLAAPSSGLTAVEVQFNSTESCYCVDAALMQLALPGNTTVLTDAYVRGNDLVATYAESADRHFRTQVYWRFESEASYFGVQLIVSVQTSRLDAAPGLTVASGLPGPAQLVEAGTVVIPLPESGVCYAELADKSNVESTLVRDTRITTNLFPGSLEKGVIRRARILGCFLPAASAEQTARMLHERFVRSELPLTT